MQKEFSFTYESLPSIDRLDEEQKLLLQKARQNTANAYAPYSQFCVSAVALLENGETVAAANQENASYPASLCAERVLLSAAASLYPNIAIKLISISYRNLNGKSETPISPCGICRQSLLEQEERQNAAIKIIMSGQDGEVLVIDSAKLLLPFGFSSEAMEKVISK